MAKTWFITGTSRGFGRLWASAALQRGDRVAATARDASTLTDLSDRFGDAVLPMSLDVTDRDAVFEAVRMAAETFGRLDVVVNNAGYGLFGMIEEVTPEQARAQFETNVFGALWVTQAALPHLRAQGGGHVIQVSSIAGVSAFANLGLYNASKWALEALGQSLALEVADFGIKVTLIEPAQYETDWGGASADHAPALAAYEPVREKARAARAKRQGPLGRPEATVPALFTVVDSDNPPLRIFFGSGPLQVATKDLESRLATWREWQDVSIAAHGLEG